MGTTMSTCSSACLRPSSPPLHSNSSSSYIASTKTIESEKTTSHSIIDPSIMDVKCDLLPPPPYEKSYSSITYDEALQRITPALHCTADTCHCPCRQRYPPQYSQKDELFLQSFQASSALPPKQSLIQIHHSTPPPPPPLPPKRRCADHPTHKRNNSDSDLPRILPIKQNGVKISDTHYWVIPAPHTTCPNQNKCKSAIGHESYINVTDHDCVDSTNGNNPPVIPPRGGSVHSILRRSHTEKKESLLKFQNDLVWKLKRSVPIACDDACYLALLGTEWNFKKAEQRLKEEILFRTGNIVSLEQCNNLLASTNWDLNAAVSRSHSYHSQNSRWVS